MRLRTRKGEREEAVRENGSRTVERAPDYPTVQAAQLLQFLDWIVPLVYSFAFLEGIAFVGFRDVGSGITGAILFAYGCSLLVARSWARREEQRVAVAIICAGFLAVALVVIWAQPPLLLVLTLPTLLAVGVTMPYVTKRVLRFLFVASWFVTVVAAILGEVMPSRSALPPWYEMGFRIVSLTAAVTVVLLLLWQSRSRLFDTLAWARAAEKRTIQDAMHDSLTGLPNRTLLTERIGRALERARRNDEGHLFALLFLDLDRFKNVNESLGHDAGDLLLNEIAHRLRACVQPADTVARLGGDEFIILLEGITDQVEAIRFAERLQEEIWAPFELDEHEIYTTASAGIVLSNPGYERPEDLLRDADTAMHHAKEEGRARYEIFNPEMRRRAVSLLRLETDLRRAVERQDFVVHYQPIVSLRSGGVVGFEALVRWQHPEQGLIPPEEFIPLAEETGLIIPIGSLVLRRACLRMGLWQRKFPDRRPLTINVNLPAAQLTHPELARQVGRILRETGLNGRDLCLEITEGAIMRDAKLAAEALSGLREQGVRVHVDDFGTGYSSLALLHRLPVDALKIDRSFVDEMETDSEKAEVVQTITTLAHSLGLAVVAEGVEKSEQMEYLKEMGCEYGQGYLFSKPVDARTAELIITTEPQW